MKQKIVGNDVNADYKELVIIMGANQGGKSTFLRSIGLAQLMMQCGMFAPAESFCSNVCDLLFIAVAESFLPEADLFRLRATLYPSDMLTLHNLKRKETVAFFRTFSQRKRLGWSESFIKMLAASTEGYALLMKERAQREAGLTANGKNL